MEFQQVRPLEKQKVDENKTVWLDTQRNEIVLVEIDDKTGIRLWLKKGVIPEI